MQGMLCSIKFAALLDKSALGFVIADYQRCRVHTCTSDESSKQGPAQILDTGMAG
jgi:hypothetical protein